MIGTTIDQYRIVSRIGGGGMGEVYRAIDLELQRDVAIKCVRPELSDLQEVTQRFRNEARTLAKLSHANIATVYRFFAEGDRLFLVMEYIDGMAFGGKLQAAGQLPFQEAVSLIRHALHGLGYAHEHGVVHRDIKPGNLMVDQRGTVKVLDFGIAHLIGGTRLTRAGSVVGTPAYMAPEQILGKQVDPRTDLYSLGIVLYELLSGQLPYQGDSEFELMRSHLEKTPPPLRDLTNSSVPPALQSTVEKALGKDKEDRFQNAAEFDAALEEAIGEKPGRSRTRTAIVPPPPAPMSDLLGPVATELRRRMRPSQIAVGAGIALFVLAGTYALFAPSSDEPDPVPAQAAPAGQQPSPGLMMPGAQDLASGTIPGQAFSGDSYRPMPGSPESAAQAGAPAVAADGSGQVMFVPGIASSSTGTSAQSGQGTIPQPAPVQAAPAEVPRSAVARVEPVQPPVQVRREPTQPAASSGAAVTPVKVSYHERQGTGRFSRDAGFNGAFTLRFPPGRSQGMPVEEIIEVRQGGQLVKSETLDVQTRVPGVFKSKHRVPGMKTLQVGLYDVELKFVAEGRTIGTYKWRLEVVD